MESRWTERGLKGAKYLVVGLLLTFAREPVLAIIDDRGIVRGGAMILFGVVGPILMLAGLYLVATRDRPPK